MARLRDVPYVLRTVGPIAFARRVWKQGSDDQLMTLAAALAYSWLFAIFPFFIFLMTFVPKLSDATKQTIREQLQKIIYLFPKAGAETFWSSLEEVLSHKPGTVWLRLIGLVFALWAASGGMAATMAALDRCYELREGRPYFRQRGLALTMTFVIATLILLVMLLLPIGGLVKAWIIRQNWVGFEEGSALLVTFDIARWALAIPFMLTALTVMYHWGPSVRHRFHWLTPGSVFCLATWVLLGLAFKIYFERFASYNKTYGAVGGVAVMLLVFYMDAAMLLWGAEINSEIDFEVLKVERGTRDFIPVEEIVEVEGPLETPLPPEEPPPT
jgi:membrane protein